MDFRDALSNKENICGNLLNQSVCCLGKQDIQPDKNTDLLSKLSFNFDYSPSQAPKKKFLCSRKNRILAKEILSRFNKENEIHILGQNVAMKPRDLKTFIKRIDRVATGQTAQIVSKSTTGEKLHWITYVDKNFKRQVILWNGHAKPDKAQPEFINEGTYGVVQSVWNVATNELLALKSVKKRLGGETCPVALEGRTITKINLACTQSENNLQTSPEVILDVSNDIRDSENKSTTGYICKQYNGDVGQLSSANSLPKGIPLMQNMRRVARAILNLREQGLSHGDLKGANILYTLNDDGTYSFSVADMGDCKSDQHWFETKQGSAFTGVYTASSDYTCRKEVYKKLSSVSNFVEKRDVFALGVIFADWLTGKKPLETTKAFHYGANIVCLDAVKGPSQNYLAEITEKYGLRMSLLIKQMLSDNHLERPSAQEVVKELDHILSHPNSYLFEEISSNDQEEIQSTMQVDYDQ